MNVEATSKSVTTNIDPQTNVNLLLGNGQTTQRSLAGEFAGVASGQRRVGNKADFSIRDIENETPSYLIAHHRRLRAQTGHMDNSLNPRLSQNSTCRKQHAGLKLEDNFDRGMVPMAGR